MPHLDFRDTQGHLCPNIENIHFPNTYVKDYIIQIHEQKQKLKKYQPKIL